MKRRLSALGLSLLLTPALVTGQPSNAEQSNMTPDAILSELMDGNAAYVSGELSDPNIVERIQATASGQHPKAVILSCLDSRVPVEMVFNQSIGDIFVGRVAGNVANDDQIGSMEFATRVAGAKLVMVLGHTACGAVKGACDAVELGNLTGLLKKIQPAVGAVPGHEGRRSSKNIDFVNAVVEKNVEIAVANVRERSEVIREMEEAGDVAIVGAIYDLATGKVRVME